MKGRTPLTLGIAALATVALLGCGGKKTPETEPRDRTEPTATTTDRDAEEEARRRAEERARAERERAMAELREPIYFAFDESELEPSAREKLQRKAEVLRTYPELRVRIEGHADERGTVEYNLALGERRAESARSYLIDLGIDGDRLTTVSYGEERPAVEGSNEAAWSRNRRDEFVPIGS
ncbi:MAG: peptidoglycan-associated lipoprotein Pal [Gemmatimonadota bacterium]|nr:peptidoglycan-associated lipoprotein Pal [Gemmatimonadota bacterium]